MVGSPEVYLKCARSGKLHMLLDVVGMVQQAQVLVEFGGERQYKKKEYHCVNQAAYITGEIV